MTRPDWSTCPICTGPAYVEPEVGLTDYYCPACGWEANGADDWGYLTMEERPFAPPEAYR